METFPLNFVHMPLWNVLANAFSPRGVFTNDMRCFLVRVRIWRHEIYDVGDMMFKHFFATIKFLSALTEDVQGSKVAVYVQTFGVCTAENTRAVANNSHTEHNKQNSIGYYTGTRFYTLPRAQNT